MTVSLRRIGLRFESSYANDRQCPRPESNQRTRLRKLPSLEQTPRQ
jgi:hypothetical protein